MADYDYNATNDLMAALSAFADQYVGKMDRIHELERKLSGAMLYRIAYELDPDIVDLADEPIEDLDASMRKALDMLNDVAAKVQ